MSVCKDRKGQDKLLHIFVVFCIAVLFGALIAHIPPHKEWVTALVAFAVALAVGIWKEFRDRRQKGNHFCVWDIVADIIGAVLGSGVAWLAAHFITRTL
jgi:VanZ like family.